MMKENWTFLQKIDKESRSDFELESFENTKISFYKDLLSTKHLFQDLFKYVVNLFQSTISIFNTHMASSKNLYFWALIQ